jgi:hypothetical protein
VSAGEVWAAALAAPRPAAAAAAPFKDGIVRASRHQMHLSALGEGVLSNLHPAPKLGLDAGPRPGELPSPGPPCAGTYLAKHLPQRLGAGAAH